MTSEDYISLRQSLGEDLTWYEVKRAFDAGVIHGVGLALRTHKRSSLWMRFKDWIENLLSKDQKRYGF